jgi:hypothetical protein
MKKILFLLMFLCINGRLFASEGCVTGEELSCSADKGAYTSNLDEEPIPDCPLTDPACPLPTGPIPPEDLPPTTPVPAITMAPTGTNVFYYLCVSVNSLNHQIYGTALLPNNIRSPQQAYNRCRYYSGNNYAYFCSRPSCFGLNIQPPFPFPGGGGPGGPGFPGGGGPGGPGFPGGGGPGGPGGPN